MKMQLFRFADWLYAHCYSLYYPLYRCWKALSDRQERRLFRTMIRPGMVVVDVGANIGIYTRYFSDLAKASGRVHAFEPAPANYEKLVANTAARPNAVVNHAAVGAEDGTIKLFVSTEMNVDHRTFDSGDGRASIDVPLVSLDGYFPAAQRIDFIKIDVQGYEMSVLRGARRILTENREIAVFLEFWPYGLSKASVDPSELLEFLRTLGFVCRKVTGAENSSFDPASLNPARLEDYCNLIFQR